MKIYKTIFILICLFTEILKIMLQGTIRNFNVHFITKAAVAQWFRLLLLPPPILLPSSPPSYLPFQFLQAGWPSCHPTNSVTALKGPKKQRI